jgi:site-specific DNA-adenine methylase
MHAFFPHLALFSMLKERDNWILSYNDCDEIRSLYRDFEIHEVEWAMGMKNVQSKKIKEKKRQGKSSEIIITNLP